VPYRDTWATCEKCGKQFVFTVEEQRRLDKMGLEVEPSLCPECQEGKTMESLEEGEQAGANVEYRRRGEQRVEDRVSRVVHSLVDLGCDRRAQDQPRDPLGVISGELEGDRAATGDTDDDRAFHVDGVEERHEEGGLVLEGSVVVKRRPEKARSGGGDDFDIVSKYPVQEESLIVAARCSVKYQHGVPRTPSSDFDDTPISFDEFTPGR